MAKKMKVKSGGPMIPGASPKPMGLDQPPHGTHPMVSGDPCKGNAGGGCRPSKKKRGMGGDCP